MAFMHHSAGIGWLRDVVSLRLFARKTFYAIIGPHGASRLVVCGVPMLNVKHWRVMVRKQ